MEKTKNDLSFDEVKLDYQAMLSVSKIACGHCLEEISRHLGDMRIPSGKFIPWLSAQWLAREAGQLVIAAETMHTLQEGLGRSTVTIVNK